MFFTEKLGKDLFSYSYYLLSIIGRFFLLISFNIFLFRWISFRSSIFFRHGFHTGIKMNALRTAIISELNFDLAGIITIAGMTTHCSLSSFLIFPRTHSTGLLSWVREKFLYASIKILSFLLLRVIASL